MGFNALLVYIADPHVCWADRWTLVPCDSSGKVIALLRCRFTFARLSEHKAIRPMGIDCGAPWCCCSRIMESAWSKGARVVGSAWRFVEEECKIYGGRCIWRERWNEKRLAWSVGAQGKECVWWIVDGEC